MFGGGGGRLCLCLCLAMVREFGVGIVLVGPLRWGKENDLVRCYNLGSIKTLPLEIKKGLMDYVPD